MSLIGLIFIVCSLIVLFDIVTSWLESNKIVDFSKNESLHKSVELVKKVTTPIYKKVSDSLPEKYRSLGGVDIVPVAIFFVLAVLGQMMW
ncbi:MAG: YggT family protein [Azospirillum sp.]|nr:YggT family protein [Azospirillum sp.]